MTSALNLRQSALQSGTEPVALSAEGPVSRAAFSHRVRALAAVFADAGEPAVGLWLDDPLDFLCAFMALALAGKRIVMPHNLQGGAASEMLDAWDALVCDRADLAVDCPQWRLAELECQSRPEPVWRDEQDVELVLFTSGTTGDPQLIEKTLGALETEIGVLQSVYGERVGRVPVVATVSHQHIYGLLHVLLWPLWRGAPFVTQVCHYPEFLAEQLDTHPGACLVASPTHLSRLPDSQAFVGSAAQLGPVFSSGGLLAERDANAMARLVGRAPQEILGSTETGGVAHRCRTDSSLWQALPGVVLDSDECGCLRVDSAHLNQSNPFVMGDRVRFMAGGDFELLGRADTVVKVEGKRLSLTEMQRRLEDHSWVEEARLAVVRGRRDEVGAVAVLSEAGRRQLAERGKRAVNLALAERLLDFFERPLLPRRWRYPLALPRNAQGKVTAADLLAILEKREAI